MDDLSRRIFALIERRDRFEDEIRHLFRDEPADRLEAALSALRPYLDDRRTLDAYLAAHEGRATRGRDAMRRELAGRFAPDDLVEARLAEMPDEGERALGLLRDERKVRSRPQAGRFLLSRGFDEEAVEAALNRFFGEG